MKYNLKKEYYELCRLVDKYEVISFDIYDTAILRNVIYPIDIFDIVSYELKKENIYLNNFKKLRIKAEEKARKCSKLEDIRLDDIYQVIANKLGIQLSNKIKQTELLIEKKFSIANKFIRSVYDYAKSSNKKIIFISDMYLPDEFICELLIENGFDKFEGIFISGSVGFSKSSTKLFHYVRKKMNINNKWLHIGDNYISDYENAIKSHIGAFYYKNIIKRAGIKNNYSISKSIMKAIQINYCETSMEINYWHRFGIKIVSSLFFGFTVWLANELKGKDNVFFLSRDGYLPYKLYKKLSIYVDGLPKAKYLHASRRAYQIPNILNLNQDDALELLTAYNNRLGQEISLGEIFDNIGLDKEKYIEIIRNHNFLDFSDTINSYKDKIRAKRVLKTIYSDIVVILQKENILLEEYLKQNMIFEFNEMNIVDVGWRGSTQKAIKDITKITINGYYFGTAYNVYDDIRNSVYGFAFNLGRPYKNMRRIINNAMMYELIFSAPHGSLIGFKKSKQKIYPILKDVENNKYVKESFKDIHISIIKITSKYLNYYEYLKCISHQDCLEDYFEFIDAKRYEDLVRFNNLTGVVGIGNTKNSQRYVTCITIEEYLNNRKKIKKQIDKNLWKNALILKGSISELKTKSFFSGLGLIRYICIIKEKILRVCRNPKKAIKIIVKIIISKHLNNLR